jgi:hypothetical protein
MRMKLSVIATILAIGPTGALAADCFGRTELQGTVNAGAVHPTFPFSVNFENNTGVVAGNQGTLSGLVCSDGRVAFVLSAHIAYRCQGAASGSDTSGFSVELRCPGSNGSDNTVVGRLLRR